MSVPRVKICGITRVEDALAADRAGADAIGLVFYAPSSRFVHDLAQANEIAQAVGPFTCVTALFVNTSVKEVEKVLAAVPIQLIQFHGDEESSYCESFGLPYLKALRVKGPSSSVEKAGLAEKIHAYKSAAGILLDTFVQGQPGGTGETFNWELVPNDSTQAIVIAGGLTPDNVATALAQTGAYGVDVSGGVESAPGIKDKNLIKRFISNAKALRKT